MSLRIFANFSSSDDYYKPEGVKICDDVEYFRVTPMFFFTAPIETYYFGYEVSK